MKIGPWLAMTPLIGLFCISPGPAEEFTFDVGKYDKKPFESAGHVQGSAEYLRLNRDAAVHQSLHPAGFPDKAPVSAERFQGELELSGLYRRDPFSITGLLNARIADDVSGYSDDIRLYEFYTAVQPSDRLRFEAGKRALRWGKGYAFNPAAFLERPKDPADPELSREGVVMAAAEYVRVLSGALRSVSLSVAAVPVDRGVNEDFGGLSGGNPGNHSGAQRDMILASRLSMLYRDTDIDIMFRSGHCCRPAAAALAMARNLNPGFAVHGEFAWFENRSVFPPGSGDVFSTRDADPFDLLLGFRYLTDSETTWFVEYYRNGAGFSRTETKRIFEKLRAGGDLDPNQDAGEIPEGSSGGHSTPGPQLMRDYLHIRAVRREPLGFRYWSAGAAIILNLRDKSASLVPEIGHTGISNLDLRLRLAVLTGGADTEFGERRNRWRTEFRVRYFF